MKLLRSTLSLIFILLPAVVLAQPPQGISEADMQKMMQSMQKMQQCMAKIDRSEVDELQKRSEQQVNTIKTLCKNGERDDAQSQAMTFARKMASEPVLKELRQCGEMMKGAMPTPLFDIDESELKNRHVCDEL